MNTRVPGLIRPWHREAEGDPVPALIALTAEDGGDTDCPTFADGSVLWSAEAQTFACDDSETPADGMTFAATGTLWDDETVLWNAA